MAIAVSVVAEGEGWGQSYGILTEKEKILRAVSNSLNSAVERNSGTITVKIIGEGEAPTKEKE